MWREIYDLENKETFLNYNGYMCKNKKQFILNIHHLY